MKFYMMEVLCKLNTWILSEKDRRIKEILKTVDNCIAALSSPKIKRIVLIFCKGPKYGFYNASGQNLV